ncbi:hypothetical protein GCM10023169_30240 [Georgenia halophila]|uniref:Uncharacterized protein n=1 Tax=Georgenia halophila TaxID=620889 RepID=A0ABP8LHY7_9MICO
MADRYLPVLDARGAELRIDTSSRAVANLYLEDFDGLQLNRRTWYGRYHSRP